MERLLFMTVQGPKKEFVPKPNSKSVANAPKGKAVPSVAALATPCSVRHKVHDNRVL